jgi:erythromycin esterase
VALTPKLIMRQISVWAVVTLMAAGACQSDPTSSSDQRAAALTWIDQSAFPLVAVEPLATTTADLTAFKAMAGSARIIGLGEGTHGSKEFFTMKDRLFRYLVEEHGVTAFAIEATMPEAFAIDTYVRTGVGNPAVLLSHLYFWTWNTQEVANLIAWLRTWNQDHLTKQVGFYGFDMQYPGVAIDSVTSFVARVAPDLSATIASDYACLTNYRNNTRGIPSQRYANAGGTVWSTCTPSVAAAYTHLDAGRTALVAASSQREFDLALQMARVVVQWEASVRSTGGALRDAAMAENAGWLLEREGPNGKLFLWAHNYHISRSGGSMGRALAQRYGPDYLPVGFAFASGGLNAVEGLGNGSFGFLKAFTAPLPTADSYEATLMEADAANYYVDLRQASGAAYQWLYGPRSMRSVGSVYFPQNPNLHYSLTSLTTLYDVLIFIETTTPTVLLPFQY